MKNIIAFINGYLRSLHVTRCGMKKKLSKRDIKRLNEYYDLLINNRFEVLNMQFLYDKEHYLNIADNIMHEIETILNTNGLREI